MTSRHAEIQGIRLHYVEQGEGPLLLFLHGFPEFWYAWKDLLPEFARDHHAVAPDMRGYHLSSAPAEISDYRVPVLVEDVHALAAHLNAGRPFVLAGHDWGGVVAWAFAMAYPNLLEAVVIVNAPHPVLFPRLLASHAGQRQASSYFQLFQSPNAEAMLAANDFALFQDLMKGWWAGADREQYLACWRRGLTGGLNYYRASLAGAAPSLTAREPDPQPLEVPALVIWGDRDTALLPANLEGLDQVVQHLTVRRFPDASHWVVHEHPREVAACMRDFLNEVGEYRKGVKD